MSHSRLLITVRSSTYADSRAHVTLHTFHVSKLAVKIINHDVLIRSVFCLFASPSENHAVSNKLIPPNGACVCVEINQMVDVLQGVALRGFCAAF